MPLDRRSLTLRARAITCCQSTLSPPVRIPNSAARMLSVRYSSAFVSSALVGMQPRLRQVPPTRSRSMHSTDLPSCAARIAAT